MISFIPSITEKFNRFNSKNTKVLFYSTNKFYSIINFIVQKKLLKFNKILVHTLIKIMYTKSIIKIVMRW